MEYQYIPDTYDYNLVIDKYNDKESFTKAQVKYRKEFISLLLNYINIEEINNIIRNSKSEIPQVKDEEYNFYHLDKLLNNDYIYLRNNIHVENLNKEEILKIQTNNSLNKDFYNKTIDRVLFEEGEETFYGEPMDETLVNSKSLIFEFAYDQKECQTIEQLKEIDRVINECFTVIKKNVEDKLNIKTSFIIYNSIPDLFNKDLKTLT